jgi:hypothetical protein
METALITAARIEQKELEGHISKLDSEYAAYADKRKSLAQRLEAVKVLRTTYGDVDPPGWLVIAQGMGEIANAIVRAQTVRENSHKARVLSASAEILNGGISVPTRDLLEQLEKRGIQFNAANKAGNLSVILSKDDKFVSDRRNGWSLRDKSPQDVTASVGLS